MPSVNPNEELLTTALFAPQLIDSTVWDQVIALGRRTNTISRIAHLVISKKLAVPSQAQRHLEAENTKLLRQRKAIKNEIDFVERALAQSQIDRIYLKGSAYVLLEHAVSAGRLFSDVDLIVAKDQILDVEALLVAAGWSESVGSPEHAQYFRDWLHELPPMVHPNRGVQVDVHHNILPATDRLQRPVDWLFEKSIQVNCQGVSVRIPCLEDLVIHSSVHLFRNGDFQNGLRDLHDILLLTQELISETGSIDGLISRAEEIRLIAPVIAAQSHITRLFPTELDQRAKQRINGYSRSLIHRVQSAIVDRCIVPANINTYDHKTKFWIDALAYFPLPRFRTMLSPLFWLKRIPKR